MIGRLILFRHIAFISLFGLLLLHAQSIAQNIKFQAVASKTTIAVGEKFRVEFKLNAGGDKFEPPSFKGFRILSGPNQSTNMQFVNGKSSYSISYSYVLMALSEGAHNITPANIKVDSEVYYSNEIKINVLKTDKSAGSSSQNPSGGQPKGKSDQLKDNLFIRAFVSNSNPFVGQHIIATYKLYYNFNIADNSFTGLPSLNGFWSEDIDVQNDNRETDMVNGVRFNVATLKKSVLIPQRSGDLELDPLEMDLVIQQPVQSRSRNLFDQFFGNYKNVKISVSSNPVKVKVKALPSGRPAGFNGAVGDYKLKVTSDRYDVTSNEAINIDYVISGRGNIKLLKKPDINFPSDFEVYDPKVEDRIVVNGSGMSGTRKYSYLAIPRHKGTFKIDPIPFSYFDPQKERYVSLLSDDLIFNIEKGEDDDGSNAISYSGTNKEEIKLLGSDIRFIKQQTTLLQIGHSFFGTIWYYVLWLLPFPIFFIILFGYKKLGEKRSDAAYMQRSRANRMAVKRMSTAKKLLNEGNSKAFYEEMFGALYGFFGDKFNLNTSEISKEKIREVLSYNNISEDHIRDVEELLNQCEMARFSPMSEGDNKGMYDKAIVLVSAIQKSLK